MPKKKEELSALKVRGLTQPGFYAVGGVPGLHLSVKKKSCSRSWILRVVIGRKRRDVGLGGYPEVSLAVAREQARELRLQIREGLDPVEERRAARERLIASQTNTVTFADAARHPLSR